MGAETEISWCDSTFNPWIGCSKVSPGCKSCYAEADMDHRRHMAKWGDGGTRHITSDAYWRQPLKWNREAKAAGKRRKVFCLSLGDVFEDRPDLVEPRRRLAKLVWETEWLDYLFLTKRPENARDMLYEMWAHDGEWPKNYWLGISIEDQQRADERIPHLLQVPAAVRFLSVEPLLGPIDLRLFDSMVCDVAHERSGGNYGRTDGKRPNGISWVIVGGESGRGARPCDIAWIRSIRDQCRTAGVPVFIKQLGSNPFGDSCYATRRGEIHLMDSKGGNPDEWPKDLRIREFPQVGASHS